MGKTSMRQSVSAAKLVFFLFELTEKNFYDLLSVVIALKTVYRLLTGGPVRSVSYFFTLSF